MDSRGVLVVATSTSTLQRRCLSWKYRAWERVQVDVGERHKKVRRCRKKELLQAASGEERVRVAEEQVRYGTRKPHTRQEDPESSNEAAEAGIAGRPERPLQPRR